ncbi:MAG TPA: TIGR03619 family F420-dependent LLM class oxidoreductase [Acidimicrobiia bacterium]|nr:TIGR03619 family F420-dependent LLM class oxidoreductase [Acidimicrobiia bacterium]
MRLGIALGALNSHFHVPATDEAERLGYESVWLPEHLVLPVRMSRSPHPGDEHPPVPPNTPVFDAFAYLGFLAGRTRHLRLGTHVYNLGLRHPFISARAVQTLDTVSDGRVEFGIGASWLEEEWRAVGLDFASRGRRVDEAIDVCKRLWTESEVAHDGEFFRFDAVAFEPKPVQQPWPPILIGGESAAALRRAARSGDGWIGMGHTFESAAKQIERLQELRREHDRDTAAFQICLGGPVTGTDDVRHWEKLGVTRLIVSPWRRSPDAVEGLRRFADLVGLEPRAGGG